MRRTLGALRQADETAGTARVSPAGDAAGVPDSEADGPAPLLPAPGLADLDRLISRTASAGVRVDVTRCGPPRDLPASIDMSAYRIVQEALTNVVKHARTSSCQVLIGYGHDELVLEVTDNGAGMLEMAGATMALHGSAGTIGAGFAADAGLGSGGPALLTRGAGSGRNGPGDLPGSGHGIIGMRERVLLLSGEFSAGPLPGYGFCVSAHIPLPAGSA